jgi:hypothetical protein
MSLALFLLLDHRNYSMELMLGTSYVAEPYLPAVYIFLHQASVETTVPGRLQVHRMEYLVAPAVKDPEIISGVIDPDTSSLKPFIPAIAIRRKGVRNVESVGRIDHDRMRNRILAAINVLHPLGYTL